MPAIEFRSISKAYPDGTLAVRDLNLAIEDGEFLCILGPSGCGKSSTLRMLAGLEGITGGDLYVDGRRINDVPARARDMAMVFENYALYPHLDVFRNIAMPLAARGVGRDEIRRRVEEVCAILHLGDQLHQNPRTLSGGQRQRVALGRALVRQPRVFLMDEPLGHLEAYMRVELRTEIRRMHEERGSTMVYITHDQEEAGAVADRIAVMNAGQLQQIGRLVDLTDEPVNRFVAAFVGEWPINLLPCRVLRDGDSIRIGVGDVEFPPDPARSSALFKEAAPELELGLRPDDAVLVSPEASGALRGRALVIEPQGDSSIVVLETAVGRLSVLAPSHRLPRLGDLMGIDLGTARVHLFAADGRNLFARHAPAGKV